MSNGTGVTVTVQPNGGHRTNITGTTVEKTTAPGKTATYALSQDSSGKQQLAMATPAGGHRTLVVTSTLDGETTTTTVNV